MARSEKAEETFGLHLVRCGGGQNAATYKPCGVLEVTRKNSDGTPVDDARDGIWLQLVPGFELGRIRTGYVKRDRNGAPASGQAMRLQFDSIHVHSQHPAWSRIDFKA